MKKTLNIIFGIYAICCIYHAIFRDIDFVGNLFTIIFQIGSVYTLKILFTYGLSR